MLVPQCCSFMAVKRCKTEELTLSHLFVKNDSVMIPVPLSLLCCIKNNNNNIFFPREVSPCRQISGYTILQPLAGAILFAYPLFSSQLVIIRTERLNYCTFQ